MRYIGWAAFYEGASDSLYLDVLLPRLIREVVACEGTHLVEVPDNPAVRLGERGRSVAEVAKEVCGFREALDVIFVHADMGGRGLQRGLPDRSAAYCAAFNDLCGWPGGQCITITPSHETEAWILADARAVTAAVGYRGDPAEVGLPDDARAAERLADPKGVLREALEPIAGRRRTQRISTIFPAIAQRQNFQSLRGSRSFTGFEARLRDCLAALNYI